MSDPNTIIFSHSQDYGYSSVDLSGLVADANDAAWIGSYMNTITSFASNPKYLSSVSGVQSFFTKGNNMVFLKSSVKSDNRLYLENSITVNAVNVFKDLTKFRNCSTDFQPLNLSLNDKNALSEALMFAALSDKTTVYCVTDKDEIIDGVRRSFFDLPPGLICRSSCIEIVGAIPEVKASVVLCKCVDGGDYESYINTIKGKSNYILIDWMGAVPVIKANISQTTYAQRVMKHIIDRYNPIFDNLGAMLHCPVQNASNYRYFDFGIDKDTYFNVVAYYIMANKYPQEQYNVFATNDEKEKIENYVLSRGIEK